MSRIAPPALRRTFRALRVPNYRLFWFGQFFSLVGTWMQSVALSWLVLRVTDSPLALGTVTMIQYAPTLAFSLFGGALADRLPKRRLLVITQTVMAIQALALAILTSSGHAHLAWVYGLAAVLGIAMAVDSPARQAFVVEMVGQEDLMNAIALNSTQFNAARIVGPALGGVAIAVVGVAGCFYLNAASFLAVIGALLLMRADRFFSVPPLERGGIFAQVSEGVRYAIRTPDIALPFLLIGIIGTFGYNFTVILPLIATYVLHAGPVGFGTLLSPFAVGSVIAALAVAYHGRARRRTLLIGAAGFSVLLFGLALASSWLLLVPLLVALGLFSIVFTATANTRLQIVAPPGLRGRVMGIYSLLFLGSTPIGSIVTGALAQRLGVQPAIALVATACILGVVWGLVYMQRHRAALLPDQPAVPATQHEAAPEGLPAPPQREDGLWQLLTGWLPQRAKRP